MSFKQQIVMVWFSVREKGMDTGIIEDVNTQNSRIYETSMMNTNDVAPSRIQQKEAMEISKWSNAFNNSNETEVGVKEKFRWT